MRAVGVHGSKHLEKGGFRRKKRSDTPHRTRAKVKPREGGALAEGGRNGTFGTVCTILRHPVQLFTPPADRSFGPILSSLAPRDRRTGKIRRRPARPGRCVHFPARARSALRRTFTRPSGRV
ncbi:hypothetical protein [Azospirillum endophyticum]